MPESDLTMVVKTVREGANVTEDALDELKDLDKGLSNVEKTMAGTRSTIGKLDESMDVFGKSVGSTTELMHGLGLNIPISPMELFGTAMKMGAEYTMDAMEQFNDYVDQISKMAAYTSTTTEEMSKLFQLSDDLRIPIGTLEMALKTMTQNGVAPSIDSLKKLSDEYNKIKDPAERAKFLLDNFGRAGQDMARFMELGSEKISENADAVQDWMIVTGKTEEEMENYKAAMDRLDEAQMRIAYTWGSQVTPLFTGFINLMLDAQDAVGIFNLSWQNLVPTFGIVRYAAGLLKEVLEELTGIKFPTFKELFGFDLPSANPFKALKDLQALQTGSGQAQGGPVFPGTAYPVGEREVEWFVPNVPGTIVPGGRGGGNVTIIVNADNVVGTTDELTQKLFPVIYDAVRQIQGAY